MADLKISALTASTTPLAGTEVLPIVQSGTTKQVSVANLTAGRAIAATNITASGEITSTTNDARISLYRATGTNYFDWASGQPLAFGTQTSSGGAGRVNKVNFTDAGNIEIANGNLVIGTSGKGIDFSATSGTGTSELLADYEEGTWTPSLGGNTTYQSGGQAGTYTKVGRIVNFKAILYINAIGTGSTTQITGLPYAAASGSGAVCAVPSYGGIATAVSGVNLNIVGSTIYCQSNVVAATGNQTANAIFASSTYFEFSGTYEV